MKKRTGRLIICWCQRLRVDALQLADVERRSIDVMGYALDFSQQGKKHPDAKPLKGIGGAGVLEIVDDYDGGTYRDVYTVRFPAAVYVLHCFQKKSKHGIATPQPDRNLIENRLKGARDHYATWSKHQKEPQP